MCYDKTESRYTLVFRIIFISAQFNCSTRSYVFRFKQSRYAPTRSSDQIGVKLVCAAGAYNILLLHISTCYAGSLLRNTCVLVTNYITDRLNVIGYVVFKLHKKRPSYGFRFAL